MGGDADVATAPDSTRDLSVPATTCWLFGAPFDVLTLQQARSRVFAAAQSREPLIFATPNVSFLAQADRDPLFREDILRTHLSLADGMPIIVMGRSLGVRFPERVAGSDLLESLIAEPGPRPLRVFFFGGEPGAAETAIREVNRRQGGLIGAGSHFPGYASIAEMSSDAVMKEINDSNADLLFLALGAAKGHRWIEANRHRLRVPVISHLGAAINYVAGRLERAPRFAQRLGLEWLWRIKEEPALARRYWRDGLYLLRLVGGSVLPAMLTRRPAGRAEPLVEWLPAADGSVELIVRSRFGLRELAAIGGRRVHRLRLVEVEDVDAYGAGFAYTLRYRTPPNVPSAEILADSTSRRSLRKWRAECLVTECA